MQTGNKTCTKHLFLSRNFAWCPRILIFCMHVSLSVLIQIEAFGGKLFSGKLFSGYFKEIIRKKERKEERKKEGRKEGRKERKKERKKEIRVLQTYDLWIISLDALPLY